MKSILITAANIVYEGRISPGDILVKGEQIAKNRNKPQCKYF